MKRSVAIARALAAQPEAVLYDEPTTMVDPLQAQLLGDLIAKLKHQLKLTSVVVTHDMRLAQKLADRIVFLHEAKVVFFGTPQEMEESNDEIVRQFLQLDSVSLKDFRRGDDNLLGRVLPPNGPSTPPAAPGAAD
jgi:phospholipid/cholesterol/gamma-HCH transport system ATP-binding protein